MRRLSSDFSSSQSWEDFVRDLRGRSYLSAGLEGVDHPAIPLLRHWRDYGVPVLSSEAPWSTETKDQCILRGCHQSATLHSDFLREEMTEFIESGFWAVLPYRQVRDLPALMLSPAAVKEERERKPRVLCDHSWSPVNATTLPHAPPEAMQFGGTLHRLLRRLRHSDPKYGPVYMAKFDIKDGFYRMFLAASDSPRLAIILPRYDGEDQLVALPLACTMGWTQSPPTFCAMSETIADVTNGRLKAKPSLPAEPHRLNQHAQTQDAFTGWAPVARDLPGCLEQPAVSNSSYKLPITHADVFVDDFILLGQGAPPRLDWMRRHLLHAVDAILDTPRTGESRNEAISVKKLSKGDGSWATRKLILGWELDSVRQTLELPSHRRDSCLLLLDDLLQSKRVGAKRWASALGKLRFISYAVPGSAALFSCLQCAQNLGRTSGRIRVIADVLSALSAFRLLVHDLGDRPTYLAEIVPENPILLGATDAAKQGMGGVFFTPDSASYLWRHPFPHEVQRRLVSAAHPTGTVTNSDLEHAGLLAQLSAMTLVADLRYATIVNFSDNTPAVSRVSKGAVSSLGPASRLCAVASAHQRLHRYCHLASFLAGASNVMADDASRLQHLTDSALLSHFDQTYPQVGPWRLLQLPSASISSLTSALLSQSPPRPPPARPIPPGNESSPSGPTSVPPTEPPRVSVLSPTLKPRSATSSSLPTATAKPAKPANLSKLTRYRTPSWQWARGFPTWVNQIPASHFETETSIPYSLVSSSASAQKTPQLPARTRSTSPSSRASPPPLPPVL